MIFVLERSLAVGWVPSIQMYSALKVTGATSFGGGRAHSVRVLRVLQRVCCGAAAPGRRVDLPGSLSTGDFPSVARM
jgi:hypothetical protein